jgi:hypothetical protein
VHVKSSPTIIDVNSATKNVKKKVPQRTVKDWNVTQKEKKIPLQDLKQTRNEPSGMLDDLRLTKIDHPPAQGNPLKPPSEALGLYLQVKNKYRYR